MITPIEVKRGEYESTWDPEISLHTKGLDSCVGIALVEDILCENKIQRKRSLAHVYYDGKKDFDLKNTDRTLEGLFSGFNKPLIYLAYNRFNVPELGHFVNPMFDHINNWIHNNGGTIKDFDDTYEGKRKIRGRIVNIPIQWKELTLLNNSVRIVYRDSNKLILNPEPQGYKQINIPDK